MCVVMVVLDAPWVEWVNQRHEHEGSNNVLNQLVLAERTVTAIMADDKQLHSKKAYLVRSSQI